MGLNNGEMVRNLDVRVDPYFVVECPAAEAVVADDRALLDGSVKRGDDPGSQLRVKLVHESGDGSTNEGYTVDEDHAANDEGGDRVEPVASGDQDKSDSDPGGQGGQHIGHDVLAVGDQRDRIVTNTDAMNVQRQGEIDDADQGSDAESGAESVQVGTMDQ